MKDFCAIQNLIDYCICDNTVTARYSIKLVNNLNKPLVSVSIKESIDQTLPYVRAKVTTNCRCITPISPFYFNLYTDGQILNTSNSKLLPLQCCIVYLTIEFPLQVFLKPIINCAIVDAKFRTRCEQECHALCGGCQFRDVCTVKTCGQPIVILTSGQTGTQGFIGVQGSNTGFVGPSGPSGPSGPQGLAGLSSGSLLYLTVESAPVCVNEDHVSIIPSASTSANASISIGPKPSVVLGFISAHKHQILLMSEVIVEVTTV